MRTFRWAVMALLLAAPLLHADGATYRLEYQIRGGAVSRLLLFFPLRVYYESSAAIDLSAHAQADGSTCFVYARVPQPAYVMRTLGFIGKTLALLTVGEEDIGRGDFEKELLSRWQAQEPEFAARVRTVKRFPHR